MIGGSHLNKIESVRTENESCGLMIEIIPVSKETQHYKQESTREG